jgi:site-specific recombinase XerC
MFLFCLIVGWKARTDLLMDQALAPSSSQAYKRHLRKFRTFCYEIGCSWRRFRSSTILMWLTKLHQDGLACGSIRSSLSGLAHYCSRRGRPLSVNPGQLRLLFRGMKRGSRGKKEKGIVSRSHLHRMIRVSALLHDRFHHVRFVAMILMAFYGFLRPSELCPSRSGHCLRWHDVKIGRRKSSCQLTFRTFKHSDE